MKRLSQSVEQTSGQAITRELVFAVDVLHVRKDGNNVRLLYAGRVEPSLKRDQEYAAITRSLKDFWFRRQRVVNLLKKLDWCTGFNRLLTELPLKQGLHSALFGQDARASFRAAEEKHKGELIMATTTQQVCLESLVLNIVGSYLRRKMKDKHDLEYSKLQSDAQKKDYVDKRESLATEAFYAVRSRNSNDDFIKYFASTICSVPQWMSADEYLSITQDLYTNTDKIRTLTMLALSARIERSDNRATKENIDND
jgi:CRISPR-associated protein Cmx8